MRFVLIALVAFYLVLAFIGCLDRQATIRSAGGKEIHEDHQKIGCGRVTDFSGCDFGVVGARGAPSHDSDFDEHNRIRPDP
jgi:hypothetical protein